MTSYVILVVLLSAVSCFALTEEQCIYKGKKGTFDISSLMAVGDTITHDKSSNQVTFAICKSIANPCEMSANPDIGSCYHQNCAGCPNINAGLTTEEAVTFEELPEALSEDDGFVMKYSKGNSAGSCTVTTSFTFICDEQGSMDSFTTEVNNPAQDASTCVVGLTLRTKAACSVGGLSLGSWLCIIFAIVTVLYCGIGAAWEKQKKGELRAPHSEFWHTLPRLALDGVKFSASGCKKGASGDYSHI